MTEKLTFDRLVERIIAVRISRRHAEVVIRLILDERIVPSIPDQDALETDIMRALDILRILLLEVFAKDGAIVSTIRLCREVHTFPRVLGERTHKALERFPEVGRRRWCRVRCQTLIEVRIRPAVPVGSVARARVVRQLDEVRGLGIEVRGHRAAVAQPDLRGLVDEDHVTDLRPGVGIVHSVAVTVDAAGPELLKQADHRRAAGPAINPDCQGRFGRVAVSRFEEPPENVLARGDIGIS